jgi:hypothetical protein
VRRGTWPGVDRLTPALAAWRPRVEEFSQLDCWLGAAGAEPHQLYGYRMEDVVTWVRGGTARIC